MYAADMEGNITDASADVFTYKKEDKTVIMNDSAMAMDFDSEGNAVALFNGANQKATIVYLAYDKEADSYTPSIVDTFSGKFYDAYEIEIVNGITDSPMFAISSPDSLTFDDFTTPDTAVTLIDMEGNRVASFIDGLDNNAMGVAYDVTTQTLYASPAYKKEVHAFNLTAVPEPASLALFGLGGLALLRRRK